MSDQRRDVAADIHTLSGAYSLHAVEQGEWVSFEEHLSLCPVCQSEVDGLREAAAALTEVAPREPPTTSRSSIVGGLEMIRQLPPVGGRPASCSSGRDVRRCRYRFARPRLLMVAAALVLVAAGAAPWLRPWAEPASPRPTVAEQVLGQPDAISTTKPLPGGATATLVVAPSVGHSVLLTDGLRPAPAGRDYQLWLQAAGGELRPVGLVPDRSGSTVLVEGAVAGATGVGITVEPDGGSPRPLSRPIVWFELHPVAAAADLGRSRDERAAASFCCGRRPGFGLRWLQRVELSAGGTPTGNLEVAGRLPR